MVAVDRILFERGALLPALYGRQESHPRTCGIIEGAMTEKDIIFLVGAAMGTLGGYVLGHLRGQCVGIAWMAKLYHLPIPPADHQPTEKTEASQS
jgi:hypothetical protein